MFLDDRRASSKVRPDSLSGLHSGDEPRDVHRVHLSEFGLTEATHPFVWLDRGDWTNPIR